MRVYLGPYPGSRSKKERRVSVRVDDYDVWSFDHTLAMIILPGLKLLREKKHGSPFVDDEDVPGELRRSSAPPVENEWDTDDNFHKRWDYVLDEMIWAFENNYDGEDGAKHYYDPYPEDAIIEDSIADVVDEDGKESGEKYTLLTAAEKREIGEFNKEKYEAFNSRVENGLRLFGKYYRGLWS